MVTPAQRRVKRTALSLLGSATWSVPDFVRTDLRTVRLAIARGDRSDRALHPSQVAGGDQPPFRTGQRASLEESLKKQYLCCGRLAKAASRRGRAGRVRRRPGQRHPLPPTCAMTRLKNIHRCHSCSFRSKDARSAPTLAAGLSLARGRVDIRSLFKKGEEWSTAIRQDETEEYSSPQWPRFRRAESVAPT
jgi:hypothetical protein